MYSYGYDIASVSSFPGAYTFSNIPPSLPNTFPFASKYNNSTSTFPIIFVLLFFAFTFTAFVAGESSYVKEILFNSLVFDVPLLYAFTIIFLVLYVFFVSKCSITFKLPPGISE